MKPICELQIRMSLDFNPILPGIKSNLFYEGVGIYAPPRDFALAEAMMHQNLWKFIHIKFEQFVGHRKKSSTLRKKMWPWRRK